jgi:hypothetical protein
MDGALHYTSCLVYTYDTSVPFGCLCGCYFKDTFCWLKFRDYYVCLVLFFIEAGMYFQRKPSHLIHLMNIYYVLLINWVGKCSKVLSRSHQLYKWDSLSIKRKGCLLECNKGKQFFLA